MNILYITLLLILLSGAGINIVSGTQSKSGKIASATVIIEEKAQKCIHTSVL